MGSRSRWQHSDRALVSSTGRLYPVTRAIGLALLLGLAAAPAAAGNGPQLMVATEPGLESYAARVTAAAAGDFSRELGLAGLTRFGPPVQVGLARESSRLAAAAPRWASAFTVPERSLIVIFPHRAPAYPDRNLEMVLRHELMHVLVYRAAAGQEVPRWFNEGLAAVAAREWSIEDRARSAVALIGRGPHTVHALEAAFQGDAAAVARAYALSAAITRSLIRRHGPDAPPRILVQVGQGVPFRTAFRQITGSSVGAELDHFFGAEAFWFTWVPFLTSTGMLWTGITLLALFAVRRRRRRNAELHAKWDLEEELAELQRLRRDDPDDRETVN